MSGYRFLLSRRWALFAVAVVLAAYGAWWLGEWQFGRLTDRKAENAVVRANEGRPPAPVAEVLSTDRSVDPDDEWRQVVATGRYDVENTVVVRFRNNDDGERGVDVVVPLVTADGVALVVDRGFVPTDDPQITAADLPQPPAGEVEVTGRVRVDGTGDSTRVEDSSTRAISSVRIGEASETPVYRGFVDLATEDPAPADAPEKRPLPELNNGPHFFYGLQWWFFGVLAVFGFGYLAYDERKRGPRGQRPRRTQSARSSPPSTESIEPVTYDAAGESRNAATRPNSAGSP